MIPELLAQYAVLFAKVINDMQLPLVHPARHDQQNETERIEYFGHYVSSLLRLTHANELERIQTVPISRPYAFQTPPWVPRPRGFSASLNRSSNCLEESRMPPEARGPTNPAEKEGVRFSKALSVAFLGAQ